jgi:DNA-binding response OmpR family regulator
MPRILLLQSDDQTAANTAAFLESRGHQVDTHKDPQSAVAAADVQLPDLVILELSLAGRSGVEFLYELRSYPDWQQLPVIIIGNLSLEQVRPFLDSFNHLGVALYLPNQTTDLHHLAHEVGRLARAVRA